MTEKSPWIITADTITYRDRPCFMARWQTGQDGLETVAGVFWHDEASGSEDDTIVLFGFEWETAPPDQETFETLMKQAVLALDDWIMAQA